MTPLQVARILQAGCNKIHDPDTYEAVRAMIDECNAIETETTVAASAAYTSGKHGFIGWTSAEAGNAGASNPGGGHTPSLPLWVPAAETSTFNDHDPVATFQKAQGGNECRVVIHFGDNEPNAQAFTQWLNEGNWSAFHDWQNRLTRPQQELPASIFGLTANTPEGKRVFDAYTRGGMDEAHKEYQDILLSGYELPQPTMLDVENPTVPFALPDDTTEPLAELKQEPTDWAHTYHEFEPKGEQTPDSHFCGKCDGTIYSDQHDTRYEMRDRKKNKR